MTTDPRHRLFDYDREPLGLLPESMKSTIEVHEQGHIATLHAPRRHRQAGTPPSPPSNGPMATLLNAVVRWFSDKSAGPTNSAQ